MKTTTSALAAHIAGEVTTLCTCWRLTRTDGTVMGFTDHDQDLVLDGVPYRAATGHVPTATAATAGLAVDNLDVVTILDDEGIAEADLRAGVFDHAAIEIRIVNWARPADGMLTAFVGHLGEVQHDGRMARAELRGLAQAFATNIGELCSPGCRATLGDVRCGVDLGPLTLSGTVATVTNRRTVTVADVLEGGYAGGRLTWTAGANAGQAMEVKAWDTDTATLTLVLPMPRPVAEGDTFTLQPGCDRSLATCRDRFANVLNFRGEPFVPGPDKAMEYGS